MKKLLFLLICTMLFPVAASASVEIDGIYYNLDTENKTAEVARYDKKYKYQGDIVIPSTVTDEGVKYSVTGIVKQAFATCSDLSSITIPSSITKIANNAFQGCTNLKKVDLNSNSIVSKSYDYESDSSIKSIFGSQVEEYVLGDDVTGIGDGAFYNCGSLVSVRMTDNVESIGENAFCKCFNLTSINMSNNLSSIGNLAFSMCYSLKSITIPSSLTSIEMWTFSGCGGLTKVEINSNAIVSGEGRISTLPSYFGNQVKEYILGENVTSIGDYAFSGCGGLTNINIPANVTYIGEGAFQNCQGLSSFNIPSKVEHIGNNAFYGCDGLTSIQVENGNTKYDSRGNCNALIKTDDNTIVVGCRNTMIPNTVTAIAENAFCGCIGLTSISIPNSVAHIGKYAFASCKDLNSLTLVNGVTNIDEYAFAFCSAITSISIPSSVTTIGYRAFDSCSSLTEIQVESENTVYDSRENCNAIISTADNILIVGCQNTIIPNSVTSIGELAFWNCRNLVSIAIPNSIANIGKCAFTGCTGLTSISIPNSVTSIEYCTFTDCSNLATVVIPNSVTKIGEGAFLRCSKLTDVYCYAEQIPETDNDIFGYSNLEATLHVLKGCMDTYSNAEQWKNFANIIALTDGDPKPTGIIMPTATQQPTIISHYDLSGRRISKPLRGLNIIKMSDGTTKKVVVK